MSIATLAKTHAQTAVGTLVEIMTTGESEAARVSAATQILDRGYGKPTQTVEGAEAPFQLVFSPLMMGVL